MKYPSFAELAKAQDWSTEEQHKRLVETHYDLYKVMHGVRPRWMDYSVLSVAELIVLVEELSAIGDEEVIRQVDTKRSYSDQDVEAMLSCGAPDKATAIRWVKQANRYNQLINYSRRPTMSMNFVMVNDRGEQKILCPNCLCNREEPVNDEDILFVVDTCCALPCEDCE